MGVFRGEPTRSVVCTCGLVAAIAAAAACAAPRQPLDTAWTLHTPRPWLAGASQALTPIVDRDSVYFCGGYAVDENAAVHAIGLEDGRLLWQQPVGSCTSIAVVDGVLVVISGRDAGARCTIEGYEPLDGSTRWRHVQEWRFCARFAAVAGDVVLLSDESNNKIVAIRVSNGRLRTFDLGESADDANRPWLTAAGSTAWFGVDDRAWQLTPGDEAPYLARELSEPAGTPDTAVITRGMLVLGNRRPGRLRAFDLESGTMLWQQSAFPQVLSLAAAGDELYANIWRQRFELVAIDTKTGIERWRAGDGGFLPPTIAAAGRLAANGEFSVFVADAATGQILHTIEVDDEVTTSPVRGRGNLVLFGTISGALHAVRVPALDQ